MKRMFPNTLALAGALCAAQVSAADAPSVDSRLKQLETQVQQLLNENKDLRKELGWDGKTAPTFTKPAGKEQKLTLGGFIQGQAEVGDAPDSRFDGVNDRIYIRRARVNLQGNFLEHFDFKLEADFGANSLAPKTGYSAQLTDCYVNWNRYDFANVRLGQFKSCYGYEQLVSDPKLQTVERSLSNDRLTDGRQIGVAVNGDVLEKRLGYSVAAFNGTSVNNSFNDNEKFMFAARAAGVPVQTKWGKQPVKWTVGVDGLFNKDANLSKGGFAFDSTPAVAGADNIFIGDRTAWGFDSQLKIGRFDLQAEYLQSHFEPNNKIPQASFEGRGFYVMGGYYILPNKLQAILAYDLFDPNTSTAGNATQEWTFGLNYYIKGDDIKLMANYIVGDQPGNPSWEGRLLMRVQLAF
jgi:phosphate-selective porin OprO and OprP